MKYSIVFSTKAISELTEQVNAKISEGWKPLGGIAIGSHDFNIGQGPEMVYLQAMTKE
jgi:hypothetical protein